MSAKPTHSWNDYLEDANMEKPQKMCGVDNRVCDMSWCQVNSACLLRDYKSEDTGNTDKSAEVVGSGSTSSANTVVYKSNTATSTATIPKCHTGQCPLGQIGKATVWLGRKAAFGSEVHAHPDETFKLLINLVDEDMMGTAAVIGNSEARDLLSPDLFVGRQVPVMAVDWPDYGVPQLPKSWWIKLVHEISHIDGHVGIFCHGGHGRTGTAASILAVLSNLVDHYQFCPVEWLRDMYCKDAVESAAQVKYIEDITGARVDAHPAGIWGVGAGQGNFNYDYGKPAGGKLKPAKAPVHKAKAGDLTLSKNQFKKLYRRHGHGQLPRPLVHEKTYWLDGHEYRFSETTKQFVLNVQPAQSESFLWAPSADKPNRYIINRKEFSAGKEPIYADLLNPGKTKEEGAKFGPSYGPMGPKKNPGTTEVLTLDKDKSLVVRKLMCAGCGQMWGETCKCV